MPARAVARPAGAVDDERHAAAPGARHNEGVRSYRRPLVAIVVTVAFATASCGGVRPTFDESTAPTPTVAVVEETDLVAAPPPTTEPSDPWEVVTITADPTTGLVHPHDSTFRYIELFDGPDGNPVQFEDVVLNPTYFSTELTLMVTQGTVGDQWVKVQLPVRPNASEAWVDTAGFTFDSHRYRAVVDLSAFSVQVFDGPEMISETGAVIGRESAPTPVGRWFVNDKVPGGGGVYGSWILSLSAFSDTLEIFDGGLPVIAIHGTNTPQDVGQALSSGCIRVPNDVVEFLVEELPLGTPVDIVA